MKKILTPLKYFASADFQIRFGKWMRALVAKLPTGRYLMRKLYAPEAAHLEVETFGMRFPSPIGLAAGYDCDGTLVDAMEAMGFGFVEVGAVTPRRQYDNTSPAVYKLSEDKALLHCADISSDGVEQVIENLKRRKSKIIVGCNLAKNSATPDEEAPTDYLRLFRPLYQWADYFTINLALNSTDKPYVPCEREQVMAILKPLFEFRRGQNQYRPLLVKISPDLSDEQIDMMTDIMIDTPLDGIIACGGTTGRHGLQNSTHITHKLGRIQGAVYGAPLRERALQVVERIHARSKGTYPIIGCGGISSPDDAMAMINAGATLLQLSTEFIYGGGKSMRQLRQGLNERMRKAKLSAAAKNSATEK